MYGELAERSRQKAAGFRVTFGDTQLLHLCYFRGELAERLLHRSCPKGMASPKTGVRLSVSRWPMCIFCEA